MFTHYTKIYLSDTDATGVIYFTQKLRLALEAFEAFLSIKGMNLGELLEREDFLFPIVHVEADYFAPLKAGDEIHVMLFATKVGTSSFTLNCEIYNQNKVHIGKTTIVHVATSKITKRSTPIPEPLLSLLNELLLLE